MPDEPILVINTGSSSLKFGLYVSQGNDEHAIVDGSADGIGKPDSKIEIKNAEGRVLRAAKLSVASEVEALAAAVRWLADMPCGKPRAIGHRVVHGGPKLLSHQKITLEVMSELRACVHFAPLHIPGSLELIEDAGKAFPDVPQFACFDTAFHSTIPETASRFPLPRELFDEGIRKYGFHGLSYESIVYQLGKEIPERVVIAHLGSGASLAAVKNGRSVDTTMGLTPTGGIPMGTRTGDLDPGVLLYLLRVKSMNADSLEEMLNHDSGLKALSGGKADMRDLEAAAKGGDQKAQLAIDIFCAAVCKTVAAYAAELGGLDLLVFTGGIGEHSANTRRCVCGGLSFMGIAIDDATNTANIETISSHLSSLRVRVMTAQEDKQIARHCRELLRTAIT